MRIALRNAALALVLAALLALVFSCAGDTESGTAISATGTAERREQAIATFTAEAGLAEPTATVASNPAAPPASTEMPSATQTPSTESSPTTALSPARALDEASIEQLLLVRAQAMGTGDFDAWYATCAPSVRESARASDALGKQMRALRINPNPDSTLEFVSEQVFFSGSTGATVVWGLKFGTTYIPGIGGGPYVKEDGEWYSIGWGCAA